MEEPSLGPTFVLARRAKARLRLHYWLAKRCIIHIHT